MVLWEQNLKNVLQIQLGLLATGLPLTETQQTMMQAIANQCRYEGGYGVLLARQMVPGQTYDDEILCSARGRAESKTPSSSFTVFPNPASDYIQLNAGNHASAGTVDLINALGQVVRTYTWEGSETRLNITDVPNGAYYLNIRAQGYALQVQQVVILR
ncbi:MAG TPA: T9SS type A sorting domain-containing protein [Saprospiraceae bacterium]|nr:T9SS type A sorting domain-containing protein [Saprospiraceae bacterium]